MGVGKGQGRDAGPGQRERRPEPASLLACHVTLGRFQPRRTRCLSNVTSQGCWKFKDSHTKSMQSRKNDLWRGPPQVCYYCCHYHQHCDCIHVISDTASCLNCTGKVTKGIGQQLRPPGFSQAAPWRVRCDPQTLSATLTKLTRQTGRSPSPLDTCEHGWALRR